MSMTEAERLEVVRKFLNKAKEGSEEEKGKATTNLIRILDVWTKAVNTKREKEGKELVEKISLANVGRLIKGAVSLDKLTAPLTDPNPPERKLTYREQREKAVQERGEIPAPKYVPPQPRPPPRPRYAPKPELTEEEKKKRKYEYNKERRRRQKEEERAYTASVLAAGGGSVLAPLLVSRSPLPPLTRENVRKAVMKVVPTPAAPEPKPTEEDKKKRRSEYNKKAYEKRKADPERYEEHKRKQREYARLHRERVARMAKREADTGVAKKTEGEE